jgi:hypothetical protein
MPDEGKPPRDVMLLHSPTDDGAGARVLRLKNDTLSVGEVRPVVEGQPINEREVVRLKPREGAPQLCDVETLYEPAALEKPAEPAVRAHGGPPKVATRTFREGWEAVFGPRGVAPEDVN